MNNTNVQVIWEALGGGGNASAAGAQIPDKTVEEVQEMLLAVLDQYFEEENGEENSQGGEG